MKKIFTLSSALMLLVSLQSQAYQVVDQHRVKVLDGSSAKCTSYVDVVEHINKAYRIVSSKVSIKNSSLTFFVRSQAIACVQTEKGFEFVNVSPSDKSQVILPRFGQVGEFDEISVTNKDLFFVAIRDGVYSQLFSVPASESKSGTTYEALAKFELDDLMTENEKKDLNKKGTIKLDFDIFQRGTATVQKNGEFFEEKSVSWGAFRIHFTIEYNKATDTYSIKN